MAEELPKHVLFYDFYKNCRFLSENYNVTAIIKSLKSVRWKSTVWNLTEKEKHSTYLTLFVSTHKSSVCAGPYSRRKEAIEDPVWLVHGTNFLVGFERVKINDTRTAKLSFVFKVLALLR